MTSVPSFVFEAIIGLILGDGGLYKSRTSVNACLVFTQGMVHVEYFMYLLLSHLCQSVPRLMTSVRSGTLTSSLQVSTRSYPFLTVLYDLFYIEGVKEVPAIIGSLLTDVSLAYWAMMMAGKRDPASIFILNLSHWCPLKS
jgi:LAGLIDADG DNA endonuclease family